MSKKFKLSIIFVVLFLFIFVSISFGYFIYGSRQDLNNIASSDCFKLNFSDGNTINIQSMVPLSEESASNLIPYEFTIKNVCKHDASYSVNIETLNVSTLNEDYVRFKIDDNKSKTLGSITSNDITFYVNDNVKSSKTLISNILLPNEEITHSLRLWVDEESTVEQSAEKYYESKIVVSSTLNNNPYHIITLNDEGITSTVKVIDGEKLQSPNKTKDGYHFEGWYDEDDNKIIIPNNDMTLYARWEYNIIPELYDGMVPVTYNDNNQTVLADTSSDWFNYSSHKWANAVLVEDPSVYLNDDGSIKSDMIGKEVSGITQYYVWIPRYKYQLFSNATNIDNLINNGNTNEQRINIEFIGIDEVNDSTKSQANGYNKGEWYVHPAFTFKNIQLSGIWVAKFEPSHTTLSSSRDSNNLKCSNDVCLNASGLRILPNSEALRYNNISNQFYASRSIENIELFNLNSEQVDTHMMKNMEWGAIAYLTYSRYGRYINKNTCIDSGCEVMNNNTYTTGCAANKMIAASSDSCSNFWNTSNGMKASTTGNQFGIYDMSGGSSEYIMANMMVKNSNNTYSESKSGFTEQPSGEYLDLYDYSQSSIDFLRGRLGDATRETLAAYGNSSGGWYYDNTSFVSDGFPWVRRNGAVDTSIHSGLFNFYRDTGVASNYISFRVVLNKSI